MQAATIAGRLGLGARLLWLVFALATVVAAPAHATAPPSDGGPARASLSADHRSEGYIFPRDALDVRPAVSSRKKLQHVAAPPAEQPEALIASGVALAARANPHIAFTPAPAPVLQPTPFGWHARAPPILH